jgi:hypothetical protein
MEQVVLETVTYSEVPDTTGKLADIGEEFGRRKGGHWPCFDLY